MKNAARWASMLRTGGQMRISMKSSLKFSAIESAIGFSSRPCKFLLFFQWCLSIRRETCDEGGRIEGTYEKIIDHMLCAGQIKELTSLDTNPNINIKLVSFWSLIVFFFYLCFCVFVFLCFCLFDFLSF